MPLTNGLVVMTPTSRSTTGTGSSSTINSNGSITFSSCASLSLNGVFTSSYDNYMVVLRHNHGSDVGLVVDIRLSASGVATTAANYTYQILIANSTSASGGRATSQNRWLINETGNDENTLNSGVTVYLFGPQLAQPTALRSVGVSNRRSGTGSGNGASIYEYAGTHSLSTSYDGLAIGMQGSMNGLVTVFGFNQ